MSNQTQLSTIQFHNQTLITFEQNNVQYVAMRPICENIGLEWGSQYNRIKRDDVLNSTIFIMKMVGNDDRNREMICLPLDYLNGWLFGIDVKRVKPEIRELLITYKKECYKALADYWLKGKAERKTTVDERTGLRDAVNMLVSKKGLIYSEAYHLVHQRFNVQSIEELTPEQLPMAVEYVHKLCLEGELIIDEPKQLNNYALSEDELQDLAWCWYGLKQCSETLRLVHKPLKLLGADLAPKVYSCGVEYHQTMLSTQKILERLTKTFEMGFDGNWRILHKLREFNPNRSICN